VIWKLKIKGNPKYHTENKPGKKSNPTNKYSEQLIPLITRMMQKPDFLKICLTDYKEEMKRKRK